MVRNIPKTPLGSLVDARLYGLSITPADLVKGVGFANGSKGLRRLGLYLATGQETSHPLDALPEALGLAKAQVDVAAASTRKKIADVEEAHARERFHPHILVLNEGGVRAPFFVIDNAAAWLANVAASISDLPSIIAEINAATKQSPAPVVSTTSFESIFLPATSHNDCEPLKTFDPLSPQVTITFGIK